MKRLVRAGWFYRVVLYPILIGAFCRVALSEVQRGNYVNGCLGFGLGLGLVAYYEIVYLGFRLVFDGDTLEFHTHHGMFRPPLVLHRPEITRVEHWRWMGMRMPHVAVFTSSDAEPIFTIPLTIFPATDQRAIIAWLEKRETD